MYIDEIIKLIDSYIGVSESEKKLLGEVFTPFELIDEMLDTLPEEVWTNPYLKWLDPANGIGNFSIIVVERLMRGLIYFETDYDQRYKYIMENMIYVCDINPKNMFIFNNLFNPNNDIKLNTHRGSFLDDSFDDVMRDVWGVDKFDIIVGNPPYQDIPKTKIIKTSGSVIWDKFVDKSIKKLNTDGFLVFVHPAIWRKPMNKNSKILNILNIFKKYNLIYLEIHNTKDGQKVFNAGTRYDFYCLKKSVNYNKTIIKDENGIINNVDIRKLFFIPNKNIDDVIKLIGDDNIEVIFDSSYHASRNYISNIKNDIFKYPVIHSTPKKGTRFLYSSKNNNGHFGIPKIIFGESGINNVIIDYNGEYGMTQGAIGLVLNDNDNPIDIKNVLESDEFNNIINSCMWSNFRIDAKLFKLFKKNWYNELKK